MDESANVEQPFLKWWNCVCTTSWCCKWPGFFFLISTWFRIWTENWVWLLVVLPWSPPRLTGSEGEGEGEGGWDKSEYSEQCRMKAKSKVDTLYTSALVWCWFSGTRRKSLGGGGGVGQRHSLGYKSRRLKGSQDGRGLLAISRYFGLCAWFFRPFLPSWLHCPCICKTKFTHYMG